MVLTQVARAVRCALLQSASSCGSSIAPRAGGISTGTYSEQVRERLQSTSWLDNCNCTVWPALRFKAFCIDTYSRDLGYNLFIRCALLERRCSHTSSTAPAGHAEGTELTWRGLYTCGNGWRGLRPGCFDMLELPSISNAEECQKGYPAHVILDGQDLGWTAAAGDASELLVVDACQGVQVMFPSAPLVPICEPG